MQYIGVGVFLFDIGFGIALSFFYESKCKYTTEQLEKVHALTQFESTDPQLCD